MDYALDIDPFPINQDRLNADFLRNRSFVYDDPRVFSKIYLVLKSLGLLFYIGTLIRCSNPSIHIIVNGLMLLSTANTARYEYQHHQRYCTVFASIQEYEDWKAGLWPKTRCLFSTAELGLKIVYFIYVFPPRFDISTICELGKSAFMIHILAIFMVYFVLLLFTSYIYCWIYYPNDTGANHGDEVVGVGDRVAVVAPIRLISYTGPFVFLNIESLHDKECCICLNTTAEGRQHWQGLPCGHIFHHACICQWLLTNQTCPVCRYDVRITV